MKPLRSCVPWTGYQVLAVLLLVTSSGLGNVDSPLPPEQERETFRLADANLVIELVAAEPQVSSPVAIAWDENGWLFVAAMTDYPDAATGGRILRLEDNDADGRYERATIFAEGLPFPTSVLPWKGGLLVAAAPNIWFLKDHDGDGHSDERWVVLTGFGEGNQQLRVNGLLWGLDNWIYGANGRSDGDIRRPEDPPAKAVSIRRRDFRFRPETGEIEAISGFSQFGLARDDWGQRFLSWNTVPIRQVVLEERYLNRNPVLAETTSVAAILDPANSTRVYPISPPPQTFNREPIDHFNASCGLTIYRGDQLGPDYVGNAFVCESLTNLVHRRILTPLGLVFAARRAEQEQEFLASTDPWFHPVNLATGPDGALYVVDFYRQWVEHPQFVPEKLRQGIDFRRGHEHGRIWRIRRREAVLPPPPRLGNLSVVDLVAELGHVNGWRRDTAQRLLVERQDHQSVPLLKKVIRESPSVVAKVHALWTLHGLQALDENTVLDALADQHPAVREQSLKLAEDWIKRSVAVRQAALSLADDRDVRVRFQCALTLGELPVHDSQAVLARMAERDADDAWFRLAILSSLGPSSWPFLQILIKQNPQWMSEPTPGQCQLLAQAAGLLGAQSPQTELTTLLELLRQQDEPPLPGKLALLAGLAEGLARGGRPLHVLLTEPPTALAEPLRKLEGLFVYAGSVAVDEKQPVDYRVLAVQVLGHARPQAAGSIAVDLLKPAVPPAVQTAAARSLGSIADKDLASRALEQWSLYTVATRREVLASLLQTPHLAPVVLDAMEQGRLAVAELDAVARETLLRSSDPAIQQRAQALLKPESSVDRQLVIRKYEAALALHGERSRGAQLFVKHCLACHQFRSQGQPVGPDLSGVASRPKERLLADLFDPSKEISPDYLSYTLVKTNGQVLVGLLVEETTTTVKLRGAGGKEDAVLRGEIEELRATGKSLMPEELEQVLSLQDVADLLAFLNEPIALPDQR